MGKRSYTIDIFRVAALLLVMVYHGWVLTGCLPFRYDAFSLVVSLGGEIGVTAFFALSGYGIYYSIASQERNGGFRFFPYMKKRCRRIMPQYYMSVLFAVVFLYGGAYLSLEGIKSIVTHLLFIHNLFPDCHGAINGVLWTMGVTFQFYIVAYPLYRAVKKGGAFFAVFCILLTVAVKGVMYAYILPGCNMNDNLEFFSGRQLITAMDNFTTGMYVAYLVDTTGIKCKKSISYAGMLAGCMIIYIVCCLGRRNGIHTNNISGYTWHSLLAAGIGIVMFFCSYIPCNVNNQIVKGVLWLSKYEYGIYIWHILIINNLIVNSGIVQAAMNSRCPKVVYLIFIALAVIVGWLFSEMTDSFVDERMRKSDKIKICIGKMGKQENIVKASCER